MSSEVYLYYFFYHHFETITVDPSNQTSLLSLKDLQASKKEIMLPSVLNVTTFQNFSLAWRLCVHH